MSQQPYDALHPAQRDASRLKLVATAILRDEAQADDVLQEAWLVTRICRPSEFEDERAWLSGVVRNLARDARRKRVRLHARERRAARTEALESTADIVSRESVLDFLRRALAELPEAERSALELRFLEDLELKEAAARLDRPVATVKHQIERGIKALRERFDREFADSRAWGLGLIAAFDWEDGEVEAALGSAGLGVAAQWIGAAILASAVVVLALRFSPSPSPTPALSSLEPARARGAIPVEAVSPASAIEPDQRLSAAESALGSSRSDPTEIRPPAEARKDAQLPTLQLLIVDAARVPVAGATALISRSTVCCACVPTR